MCRRLRFASLSLIIPSPSWVIVNKWLGNDQGLSMSIHVRHNGFVKHLCFVACTEE